MENTFNGADLLALNWETGASFGAVSYTHLDVYKRQGIGQSFCNE